MDTHHTSRRLLLASLLPGMWLAGCASAPPTAEKFVDVPPGTVFEYHRKSSGSYGQYDDRVAWKNRDTVWQGQPVIFSESPQAGIQVYERQSKGMVATLTGQEKPVLSYAPPISYHWPMKVGDQWTTEHQITVHATGKVMALKVHYSIESYQPVNVPAGTFNTYKVVMTDSSGEVQQVWVAPADSVNTVMRILDRPATHPQGAGHLEGVLMSRKLPPQQ